MMNMEYSFFEKMELLLDNFESVDEANLYLDRNIKILTILANTNYFPKDKVIQLVTDYFKDYEVIIDFSFKAI